MNRDKYLENIEIKNRRLLLKIYKKHINKLKIQIYEATERGNDTVYLQNLHNQVEKEIIQFEKELKQYSAGAVKTSYDSGAKTAVVGDVAKEIAGTYVFGSANNQAMQVLAKTTYQPLSKMAQQIGRATLEYMKRENFQDTQSVLKALGKFVDSEYLRKTGVEGIGNVVVGSESWQTAARKIRDKIINEANIKVPYYNKKGDVIRYVHAQDYAKMVSRTTTANVFREGAKDRILDTWGDDGDLVEIIGNSDFPNSPCIPYQGQILSLEGQTKGYTTIKEAKANGLFHPNCIHNFAVTDKVIEIYRGMESKGDIKEKQQENKEDALKVEEKEIVKSEVLQALETSKIEKVPFNKYKATPSTQEIINKVGGGDMTKGSCSSLALAYAGNKGNMEILDFRGGDSCSFFSRMSNILKIGNLEGVESFVEKSYNDYTAVNSLLKNIVNNKEYYFATGRHAAIVRKIEGGFEYLELQTQNNNGFKPLTKETLKRRFSCQKSHTLHGRKIETNNILINIETLAKNTEFQEILKYINTNVKKQMKGTSGFAK
jgi:hypothetical protein